MPAALCTGPSEVSVNWSHRRRPPACVSHLLCIKAVISRDNGRDPIRAIRSHRWLRHCSVVLFFCLSVLISSYLCKSLRVAFAQSTRVQSEPFPRVRLTIHCVFFFFVVFALRRRCLRSKRRRNEREWRKKRRLKGSWMKCRKLHTTQSRSSIICM